MYKFVKVIFKRLEVKMKIYSLKTFKSFKEVLLFPLNRTYIHLRAEREIHN